MCRSVVPCVELCCGELLLWVCVGVCVEVADVNCDVGDVALSCDHDGQNEETWLKTLTTCLSVGQRDMGGAKDGRRVRKASDKWTRPFSK